MCTLGVLVMIVSGCSVLYCIVMRLSEFVFGCFSIVVIAVTKQSFF